MIDYFSRWVQEKNKQIDEARNAAARKGLSLTRTEVNAENISLKQISNVEAIIKAIPVEVMSDRAIACKIYARALFYWEQYIRQRKDEVSDSDEEMEEALTTASSNETKGHEAEEDHDDLAFDKARVAEVVDTEIEKLARESATA